MIPNYVFGTRGPDALIGTTGDVYIDWLTGADAMTGLAGDDVYVVDDAGDTVVEATAEGFDRVYALVS